MTDFNDFVSQVFSKDPQEPNSIQLEIDIENPNTDVLFSFLLEFALSGIKILYGEDIQWWTLDEEQINTLNNYIQSIGFNMVITTVPDGDNNQIRIHFDHIY